MDFKITPGTPDGICVEVKFVVESWDKLYELMSELDSPNILLKEV